VEETPDPTDTVTVLKSDLELLQKVADYAVEDACALFELLGIACPEGTAPREFFYTRALPAVAALLQTQQNVNQAAGELSRMASRFDHKTIDLADGRKAVKVGQRIPGLLTVPTLSRAERRRIEREGR
jgi:hypothetical protein